MREILFRGKLTDGKGWMYGYYSFNPTTNIHWIRTPRTTYWDEDMIAPSTLGQYTGLKDKNGKRIFEGDVIKRFWLGAEIIYCVQYDVENAHFIGKAMNKSGFTTFDNYGEMFEVIGNIHDNPEMLKGGEG